MNLFPLALASLALAATGDGVTVGGHTYPATVEATAGDRPVTLALTGAAVRTKYFVTVYTVGSYVQQGVAIQAPEALATADCAKQLLLILARDVAGTDMASATEGAIRANYPAPQFAAEVSALRASFAGQGLKAGDHVRLTHVPGVGLRVAIEGRPDALIRNPAFSRAVWDIYVGRHNLGDGIKNALVSR